MAEAVFAEIGISPEEAVAIFYKQTALQGSFPPVNRQQPRNPADDIIVRRASRLGPCRSGIPTP